MNPLRRLLAIAFLGFLACAPGYLLGPPVTNEPPSCVVVGVEIDVEAGVLDEAGTRHYPARSFTCPCDSGSC